MVHRQFLYVPSLSPQPEIQMTGAELRDLRRRSGMSYVGFGIELGFGGKRTSISRNVRGLEGLGDERIPLDIAKRARIVAVTVSRLESQWAGD